MFETIENYRDEVRLTTTCPACSAAPTELCLRLVREHDPREVPQEWIRTAGPVDYVHDERSLLHANLILSAARG